MSGDSGGYFKASGSNALDFHVAYYIGVLSVQGTEKTLLGTLHALFKKQLSEEQLTALFTALRERGIIKVDGNKVTYDVSSGP